MELIYLIGFFAFIFIITFIVELIKTTKKRILENRYYKKLLMDLMPFIQNVEIETFTQALAELETKWKELKTGKVILRNSQGEIINLCKKCGGYMQIVKWRGDTFLGCSNYPSCRSTKRITEIKKIEF
jgi:hypothetical protein